MSRNLVYVYQNETQQVLKLVYAFDTEAQRQVQGCSGDRENHTHLFIDNYLRGTERISFHPNDNTATLVIPTKGFIKFLDWVGNTYEFLELHDMEHSAFGSPK